MPHHIALLGDSVFDNRAYTGREPDVVGHLRKILPNPWRASLCAVDGSTTADLEAQLPGVPSDASHVVISLGGNDVLRNSDLLVQPVRSMTGALALFVERVARFETAYRAAIEGALALGRQTTVCTIYNGDLDREQASLARVALTAFNDVILRAAFEHQLAVIDLRLICNEAADYTNQIEPSGRGGRKIAEAVARSTGALGGQLHVSTVFAALC